MADNDPEEKSKKIEWKETIFVKQHFHDLYIFYREQLLKATLGNGAFPEVAKGEIEQAFKILRPMTRKNLFLPPPLVSRQGIFSTQHKKERELPKDDHKIDKPNKNKY